jgi:hypothetical protein
LPASPLDVHGVDQGIDGQTGIVGRFGGQVGVSGGGQDADMAKDLLQLKQIDSGLQHVGGVAVAQGMA